MYQSYCYNLSYKFLEFIREKDHIKLKLIILKNEKDDNKIIFSIINIFKTIINL